jgi:hypothetical protein
MKGICKEKDFEALAQPKVEPAASFGEFLAYVESSVIG